MGRRTPEKAKIICPPPSGVDIIKSRFEFYLPFKKTLSHWDMPSECQFLIVKLIDWSIGCLVDYLVGLLIDLILID